MERNADEIESIAQIKDMVSGVVAGFFGKAIEYPFDTIKVLCQIQDQQHKQPAMTVIRNILYNEGFFRFYRGLSVPLYGCCVENLIIFSVWAKAERMLKKYNAIEKLSIMQTGYAGIASGTAVALWLAPIEYIKCQMQAPKTAAQFQYRTWNCAAYFVRHHPLQLMTTGLWPTMIRESFGGFFYFTAYRGSCRFLQDISTSHSGANAHDTGTEAIANADPSPWIVMTGGGIAGLTYWTFMYPVDLIKTLMQTQLIQAQEHIAASSATAATATATAEAAASASTGFSEYHQHPHESAVPISKQSMTRVFIDRYKLYGFRSFYPGFGVTGSRAVLSNAVIFSMYEYTRNLLDLYYPSAPFARTGSMDEELETM